MYHHEFKGAVTRTASLSSAVILGKGLPLIYYV
ncbi:hypothetical protein PRUB_b6008 [Pseudoalteromonas rubra]|uniref:Uncharacterized protein n=1 Tax=Pseudoalteromonas rubra TaxID=43658 RepID=A0A8T0C210_9GAMM|nr:hypothetical protein PRUB_b6008 [Pseudoalteromonas rubra]